MSPIRWFERNADKEYICFEFGTAVRFHSRMHAEQRRYIIDRVNTVLREKKLNARCGTFVDGVEPMVFHALEPCADLELENVQCTWWWKLMAWMTSNYGEVFRFGKGGTRYLGIWHEPDKAFSWKRIAAWYRERDKVWVCAADITILIVGRWHPARYESVHLAFDDMVFKDAGFWRVLIPETATP